MTKIELARMLYETHVENGSYAGGVAAFPWESLTQDQRDHWRRTTEGLIEKLKKSAGPMGAIMIGKLVQ